MVGNMSLVFFWIFHEQFPLMLLEHFTLLATRHSRFYRSGNSANMQNTQESIQSNTISQAVQQTTSAYTHSHKHVSTILFSYFIYFPLVVYFACMHTHESKHRTKCNAPARYLAGFLLHTASNRFSKTTSKQGEQL